jgi:protein SCO1/2
MWLRFRVVHVRVRFALVVATSLLLLAALSAVVLAGRPVPDHNGLEGAIRPKIPVQDFSLRDQDGDLVHLGQFRGKVVMLTFLYSTCRDSCPVTAMQMKGAMDLLGHDVPALAVSVDPANDTPLNAKRFLLREGLTGRMSFLLGSARQLQRVWTHYGIRPRGNRYDHSAYVLLLDRTGRQRVGWPVSELTPEGLEHDLRVLGA